MTGQDETGRDILAFSHYVCMGNPPTAEQLELTQLRQRVRELEAEVVRLEERIEEANYSYCSYAVGHQCPDVG